MWYSVMSRVLSWDWWRSQRQRSRDQIGEWRRSLSERRLRMVRELGDWWRSRSQFWLRTVRLFGVIVVGLALVVLPTAVALFPYLAKLPGSDRVRMLLGWIAVAIIAVGVTTVANDRLQGQVESQRAAVVTAEQRAVIRERLAGLLTPGGGGLPPIYSLTVYAPSPDGNYLIPVFPRVVSLADPAIFLVGVGSTGKAWQGPDETVLITGPAVWSDQYGLTPLQQRCFRSYDVVASVVIKNRVRQSVGVLSAISRTNDGFLDRESGMQVLQSIAAEIAWVMPEAIHWMLPTEEEMA